MADWYNKAQKTLDSIQETATEINSKLISGIQQNPEDVIYNNAQFMKLMGISKRTAQEWRNKKIIGYFQIGAKIYYTLHDVQQLLKENYNPKK